MDDEYFMNEALNEAQIALHNRDWPIGCVIVLDGKIIARSRNQVHSKKDRLAHAEIIALDQTKELLRKYPNEAILYSTYEPCPMCFGAAILSRIKRVVCGVDLDQSGAMYFRNQLPLLFKQDKFSLDFVPGVLAKNCREIFLKSELAKDLIKEGRIKELAKSNQ